MNVKSFFKDKLLVLFAALVIILASVRLGTLPLSPPGFYTDEMATASHVEHMLRDQTSSHGEPWPFYSQSLGGGFTTPIYLYPLTGWAWLFGTSETALRAFSQFVTLLAVLFVALAVRLWFGTRAALIAAIVGLALPWSWLQGSLAWDPAMVPLFAAAAFYGWSLLMQAKATQRQRLAGFIILPAGLLLLAYVYPPYWVSSPLLMAAAYLSLLLKKRISWHAIFITVVAASIASIPLGLFILSPDTLGRSSSVSVFQDGVLSGLGSIIVNIGLLFNPFFWFIYGDSNLRHAVGPQGMLGIAALLPVAAAVWAGLKFRRKSSPLLPAVERLVLVAAAAAYLLSMAGAILTGEGQPHSLRACAAWIFAVVVITIGWRIIFWLKRRWVKWIAVIVFCTATLAYIIDLTAFYPARSADAFDGAAQYPTEVQQ